MNLSHFYRKYQENKSFTYPETDNTLASINLSKNSIQYQLPYEILESFERAFREPVILEEHHITHNQKIKEYLIHQPLISYQTTLKFENIVLCNNFVEGVRSLIQAVINPSDEVLVFSPYIPEYTDLITMCGGIPKIVALDEEEDFEPELSLLEKAYNHRTKMLILNNPHYATGKIWPKELLKSIYDWAIKKNVFIIADEHLATIAFEDQNFTSMIDIAHQWKNIAIIQSLPHTSKHISLSWIVAHEELIHFMTSILSISGTYINPIQQTALAESWDALLPWIQKNESFIKEQRESLYQSLNKQHGFRITQSQAGLMLFVNIQYYLGNEVGGEVPRTSEDFCRIVFKQTAVKLKPSELLGREGFIGISYGETCHNIQEAIKRISQILEK